MRLIILNGAKNCGKEIVARSLAKNSDCKFIRPYTDHTGVDDEYIRLNESKLSAKMERENPLYETVIDGYRWVFFENQLNAGYVVLIGDDRLISYFRKNWSGELITVRVHSNSEEPSNRSNLSDDNFDIVFNVDSDDMDELEELVGDIYLTGGE